ncbi:MAG TPA: hypothetical protein VFA34_06040 [Actinomycetota bacterium]|jgi:hypothetical protein|nr:hypothetical protein [Actinomycetota bacterium]
MTNNGQKAQESAADVLRVRWRTVLGWVLVAVGALFIVLGWIGVSGEPDVARQMSYLASGGVGGLTAALVGIGLLISEDLRSDRKRLGRIEATLLDVNQAVSSSRRRASKAAAARRR